MGVIHSDADSVPKIIAEMVEVRNWERENRVINHDREGSMELEAGRLFLMALVADRPGFRRWRRYFTEMFKQLAGAARSRVRSGCTTAGRLKSGSCAARAIAK